MSLDVLIKFGERCHMDQLLNEGVVYLNTLVFHRAQEHNVERHDPNEGIERIMQIKGGKINRKNLASGEFEEVATITTGVARVRNSNLEKLNVFCMFHFVIPDDEETTLGEIVSERVWSGFGDSAVIIWDAADFVTRVKRAAGTRGVEHMRRLVEYVDMSFRHDEVGPFMKDKSFSHQRELRIALFDKASEPGPISLNVGSISDIACLVPAHDVPDITIKSCLAQYDCLTMPCS